MNYRVFLMGLMALGAASLVQAQDYDDIYYDASKSSTVVAEQVKVAPAKTVAVYGEVPEKYKVAVQSNYSTDRDVDEYNRRGAYEPGYEIDLNGDTIYEEAFANTRRIERFYNPDIVILSDDDDLVELYYDESPTIDLIIGSEWGSPYGYSWASSYYPWYTGYYYPWYSRWYDPWYSPYYYGWYYPRLWGWGYTPWHFSHWGSSYYWGWGGHPHGWYDGHWAGHHTDWGRRGHDRPHRVDLGTHAGLGKNRNGRTRVGNTGGTRVSSGHRGTGMGSTGTRVRGEHSTSRGGNLGSRGTSGVTPRSSGGVSRPSTRSSSYGGSRSSGYSGGSRSSGSYSGGSRSSGSYSGGSSSRSSSSGGGSRGSGGGGGGHRR